MMGRRDVSLVLVMLVMSILSTEIKANKQRHAIDNKNAGDHHHHHQHQHHQHQHQHHHKHHHDDTITDDDGEDLTSQAEDNGLLPSHRHEHEEEEEEFYDDYSSRRELFQLTDRNGDGYVTRDEYVMQNGNLSAVVDQVFMAYDGDGDGRFSEEEFLKQSSPLAVHDECEEQIIQTCDKLYLEFRTTEPKANNVDETACKAVQYLVDCVVGFDTDCNIMSYAQAVASRAGTYLDSGACPLLYLQGLHKLIGHDGLTDGIKARFARSVEDVESTTVSDKQLYSKLCPDSFISRCSVKFRKSLRQDKSRENYCPILASYGHCLRKRARYCPANVDDPLLRQNLASLRKLRRAAKWCPRKRPSFA